MVKKTEIRFHGRGGQGLVIASKILAQAYLTEYPRIFVQSFPEFGAERRGAPTAAFLRIGDKSKNRISTPDHVIIFDEALIKEAGALGGLKENGWVILNTSQSRQFDYLSEKYNLALIDARRIAKEYGIGSKTQPVINTVILGSFVKASLFFKTNRLNTDSIQKTILASEEIPNSQNNMKACLVSCETTEILRRKRGRHEKQRA